MLFVLICVFEGKRSKFAMTWVILIVFTSVLGHFDRLVLEGSDNILYLFGEYLKKIWMGHRAVIRSRLLGFELGLLA